MRDVMLVGVGGFVGAVSRYYLSGLVLHLSAASRVPWATLVVNTLGCLVIGVLAGSAELRHFLSPSARLFLFTGLLGGFTTFSSLMLDALTLWQAGSMAKAVANLIGQLVIGCLLIYLGYKLGLRTAGN